MITLHTPRLTIRPFISADLQAIHRMLDVDLQFESLSLAERTEWLQWAVANDYQLARIHQPPYGDLAVVLTETGTLIGSVGFVPTLAPYEQLPFFGGKSPTEARSVPEVGLYYAYAPAYQGYGYSTEAASALITYGFTELSLKRIIATTEYTNEHSQAVMRRLGMQLERNPFPDPFWLQIVGILEHKPHQTA